MSTTSLLSQRPTDSVHRSGYSYEPHDYRVVLTGGLPSTGMPATGTFVKQSRNGNASLRLFAQAGDADLPVYDAAGPVEGLVELSRTENVSRVEVKVEGLLRLREIAEGGHSTVRLCLDTRVLYVKDRLNSSCPSTLKFSLHLPPTFTFEEVNYDLPPTFSVKLSGLPGFTANIDYSVSAIVNKPNASSPVTSKAMGLFAGTINITTPFLYFPRTRPPSPLPPPLSTDSFGFTSSIEWNVFESVISSRRIGMQDIMAKLYIPATRTYCLSQRIPVHVLLSSSPISLSAFLPMSPTAVTLGQPKPTRLQVMRQSTVDVRNVVRSEAKREMWRVDCIGEASFRVAADAPNWIAYSGEIQFSSLVRATAFRAAGLSVKDCLLFTMNPPDPLKSPFNDLRQVIGIRLTTDPWAPGQQGTGPVARPSSLHSSFSL
ncbi:hypothetical protein CC1G_03003 [Coprinopsis cinerea okayama7|uniref:Arrestin-like N-terminal domain-containing protein n=1 Tax=Coprinopsis cinerea (strain Okayama-7 / 130 / ATCC MYA-4618 / FGSC 9003) TaxID=240176 RepID=A8NS21_COPC7|nr:hypothetical protein CC1G_03003 [Coprinopsis cinerea okayama7\|eukprot:XP_001835915.2 hypothetical protein CC1G_03003 [Coprinopsis cinerea okayama7\